MQQYADAMARALTGAGFINVECRSDEARAWIAKRYAK